MFLEIEQVPELPADGSRIWVIKDTCFSERFITEVEYAEFDYLDVIANDATLETMLRVYSGRHLYVPWNLYLYYQWLLSHLISTTANNTITVANTLSTLLEAHTAQLSIHAPHFKYGTQYVPLIKRFFERTSRT